MPPMLTWDEIERRKDQAVRFVRDVLDRPDRAEEIEDESLEDYAERKGFAIANPNDQGETTMAYKTRDELAQECEELRNRLDAILEMASHDEEDGDDVELAEADDEDDEEGEDDDAEYEAA